MELAVLKFLFNMNRAHQRAIILHKLHLYNYNFTFQFFLHRYIQAHPHLLSTHPGAEKIM